MPLEQFSKKSADFLIELNRIHPFREGSGRTQRLMLSQISLNAGYNLSWDAVSPSTMKNACVNGLNGQNDKMKKILTLNLSHIPKNIVPAKENIINRIHNIRNKYLVHKKSIKKKDNN